MYVVAPDEVVGNKSIDAICPVAFTFDSAVNEIVAAWPTFNFASSDSEKPDFTSSLETLVSTIKPDTDPIVELDAVGACAPTVADIDATSPVTGALTKVAS